MDNQGNAKSTSLKGLANSSAQADWQAICILAAMDLYSVRLQNRMGSPPSTGLPTAAPALTTPSAPTAAELSWITSEINLFKADLNRLTSSCSSVIQGVISSMVNVSAAQFRSSWRALTLNPTGFNGGTFGAWLKSLSTTDLQWPVPTKPPAAGEAKPNFYSILFFADMQSLFVGALAYLDSYWLGNDPNVVRYSAQLLSAHYFNQIGSATQDYFNSMQYLTNIIGSANFFPPYGNGYAQFVSLMQSYVTNNTQPQWVTPPVAPYTNHNRSFTNFLSKVATNPLTFNMAGTAYMTGLNDMGNYMDGAVTIASQLVSVYNDIQSGFNNNQFFEKLPDLNNYCDPTKSTSIPGIIKSFKPTSPDGTSPYVGLQISPFAVASNTDGFLNCLNSATSLGSYAFIFSCGDSHIYENSSDAVAPPASPAPFTLDKYTGVTVPGPIVPPVPPPILPVPAGNAIRVDGNGIYTPVWTTPSSVTPNPNALAISALTQAYNAYMIDQ